MKVVKSTSPFSQNGLNLTHLLQAIHFYLSLIALCEMTQKLSFTKKLLQKPSKIKEVSAIFFNFLKNWHGATI